MSDRYLLESGTPDGYLLEDGSGVLLREEPTVDFVAIPALISFSGGNKKKTERSRQGVLNFNPITYLGPPGGPGPNPGIPIQVIPGIELTETDGPCVELTFDELDWNLSFTDAEISQFNGYHSPILALTLQGAVGGDGGAAKRLMPELTPSSSYVLRVWLNPDLATDTTELHVVIDTIIGGDIKHWIVNKTDLVLTGFQLVEFGRFTAVDDCRIIFIASNDAGSWVIDDPEFCKLSKVVNGRLSFSSVGYRSRNGDCLVEYPIDPCGVTSFVTSEECAETLQLVEPLLVSLFVDDDVRVNSILTLEDPAPFTVYNVESDGCPLHDGDQGFSYQPPSRGSELDFIGRLITRSTRIYRSDLGFSGYLLRGRRFLAGLSFSALIHRKDGKKVPGIVSFNGSVTKVKTLFPAPTAWFKAENYDGTTTWPDSSGNGYHLTAHSSTDVGGIDISSVRPRKNSPGTNPATTHLYSIDGNHTFNNPSPGLTTQGFFRFDTLSFPNQGAALGGVTIFFILRDFQIAAISENLRILGNSADSNASITAHMSGSNVIDCNSIVGGTDRLFGVSEAHTDGNDLEYWGLRVANTTGVQTGYKDGAALIPTGDIKLGNFTWNSVGRGSGFGGWRDCSICELLIYNHELTNPEMVTVNTYLANRIAGL
jgi:hypothetical protein